MIALIVFMLAAMIPLAQAERVTCAVKADTWVDAPPFSRTSESPAAENHGAGAVSFRQASDSALDHLRLRVAEALAGK
ncbi:MAG: hypothetical protein JJE04_02310 [Acidobacteriia bacterium]|nr:hypothetical protein [Terriglobia bacterium]